MEDTRPKPFVFVLMPFEPSLRDAYELGIKAACASAGAYSERADEQVFDGSILERVYSQISRADIIVAEMSGQNPNVFYETGYAHALNKRVVLLTNRVDDIPFDLKHFPHVVYGGRILELRDQLERRIRWFIQHPRESCTSADPLPELFVNGVAIDSGVAKVEYAQHAGPYSEPGWDDPSLNYTLQQSLWFHLSVGIHNTTGRTIDLDDFTISLVLPQTLAPTPGQSVRPPVRLPDGRYFYGLQPAVTRIFPEEWAAIPLSIRGWSGESKAALRTHSELGPRNYPFVLSPEE